MSLFKNWRNGPWLVFMLVIAWKLALFIFTAQPIPANDSFFYDGAVVNKILNGAYVNPSIAEALPISGKQLFSAYPPFYQMVLYGWMSLFGTSAISAMALHLVLFIGYAYVVFLILRRLDLPNWCMHFAGAYLLLLTFHDRPDALAHLLGMSAVYASVRSRTSFNRGKAELHAQRWLWTMAACNVLALCTSLQIGTVYLMWIWFGMLTTTLAGREKFPALPMTATIAIPLLLVLMVRLASPVAWNGFLEHALQTPSFTGFRHPSVVELLKVARTAPGIFLVAILLPLSWFKQHNNVEPSEYARLEFLLLPALLGALGIVAACLFVLTANTVAVANYLQPIIVATYLGLCATIFAGKSWVRWQIICLFFALAVGSIRAVGMSTWGVACAADVGYPTAMQRVDAELKDLAPGTRVVASSAFLYRCSKHRQVRLIHSDWMGPAKSGVENADVHALLKLKPRKMLLTQFDYYRRHQAVLELARQDPSVKDIQIVNTTKLPAPDSIPSLQRVVQHISWAPVVVNLDWKEAQ